MVVLRTVDEPMWDQPGVHEIYRGWRRILDGVRRRPDGRRRGLDPDHRGDGPLCARRRAAPGVQLPLAAGRLVGRRARPGHRGDAGGARRGRTASRPGCSATTTYPGTRRGTAAARSAWPAPGPRRWCRWRCPGSAYLYQGEELGLEDVDVAPEHRQDPSWFRTGKPGRDGCRVPIPWSGDRPPYGFGPGSGQPWIPQPDDWAELTVAAQQADPDSTLAFYRRALWPRGASTLPTPATRSWSRSRRTRSPLRRGELTVVLNCGATPVPMPPGELLIASAAVDGSVPPDTAVWVRSR